MITASLRCGFQQPALALQRAQAQRAGPEQAEAQAVREQAAAVVVPAEQAVAARAAAPAAVELAVAQQAADRQAVAAAGAPALPQAAELAGAAVQKHTAVDTGAAKDEALHAPHGLRRGSIDPMNTNFTHAVVIAAVDVIFTFIVVTTGLHALQWAIAKHRGTLFTAGPETMYQ